VYEADECCDVIFVCSPADALKDLPGPIPLSEDDVATISEAFALFDADADGKVNFDQVGDECGNCVFLRGFFHFSQLFDCFFWRWRTVRCFCDPFRLGVGILTIDYWWWQLACHDQYLFELNWIGSGVQNHHTLGNKQSNPCCSSLITILFLMLFQP
jgi:hypothetical protein